MNDPNRPENNQGGQGGHPPQQPGNGAPPNQYNQPSETGSGTLPQGSPQAPPNNSSSPSEANAAAGQNGSGSHTEAQQSPTEDVGSNTPPQGEQQPEPSNSAAQSTASGSASPPSGSGTGGSGSSSSGPRSSGTRGRSNRPQEQPRSRAFLWLFILALTGAVGGMGYFGYQEFYLKEFAALEEKVAQLNPETLADDLEDRQQQLLAGWQERTKEVEQRLEQVEERSRKLAELETQYNNLEESLAEMEGLDELRKMRDQLDTDLLNRIDQALAEVEQLEGLEDIQQRFSNLESRLATLENKDGNGGGPTSEQLSGIEERIGSLADRLTNFEDQLVRLEERLAGLDEFKSRSTATAEQVASLEQRLEQLTKQSEGDEQASLDKARQLISELEEQLGTRISELDKKVERLDTLSPEGEEAWIRAEARHLVQIAVQRVRYHKDVDSALEALKSADSLYAELGGAAVDQREAVGAAIDALLEYSPPDIQGIRERLIAQINGIDNLALHKQEREPLGQEMAELDSKEEGWQRAAARLREGLGSLVRIERADEVKHYVPAKQRYFIRENLRMQIEGAILALNRGEEEMFQNNLERAVKWLKRYFDGSAENVAEAQQELEDIAQKSIELDPPDIQSLLDPVKSS